MTLFRLRLVPLFLLALYPAPSAQMDTFYFTESPRDARIVVTEGQPLTLRCDVNDYHLIRVHWTKDDADIADTPRRYVESRSEYGTWVRGANLRFARVARIEDAGAFRCVATNVSTNYAIITPSATRLVVRYLDDNVRVTLKSPRSAADVRAGVDVTLRCDAEGDPAPRVEWYKNGIRLFEAPNKMQLRNKQLTISRVTSGDNGSFSCRAVVIQNGAEDLHAGSVNSFALVVDSGDSAVIEVLPANFVARKNSAARIDCRYRDAVITEWYYMEEGPLKNNSKHSVFPNGTLSFAKARAVDEGLYKCVGLANTGPTQTYSAKMTVAKLEEMNVNNFEPRFGQNPLIWREGTDLELRCRPPYGFPEPAVVWELPPLDPVAGSAPLVDALFLRIPRIDERHSGNYSCVANNFAGEKRATALIKVVPKARLVTEPLAKVTVDEETDALLHCKVSGSDFPTTRVRWKKNGVLVSSSTRLVVGESTGELRIKSARLDDAGNYACVLINLGWPPEESRLAALYVKRKLKFNPKPVSTTLELGSNHKIYCNAEGDDKEEGIRVKWFKMLDSASLQLQSDWPDHVTDSDGVLQFSGVVDSDGGRYTCVATGQKRVINATISLTVVVKPRFSVRPQNATVKEGETVLIDCAAEGDPPPTIQWDKDRQVGRDLGRRFNELDNGSLLISEVEIRDAGTYGCTAGNSGGFSREEILLLVQSSSLPSVNTEKNKFPMTNTIAIAVGCAVGYMALAVGLLLYCRHRRLKGDGGPCDDDDDEDDEEGILNRDRSRVQAGTSQVGNGRTPGDGMVIELRPTTPNGLYQAGSDKSSIYHKYEVIGSDFGGVEDDGRGPGSVKSKTSKHSNGSAVSGAPTSDVRLTFSRQKLESLGMLGRGEFGDVFVARARGIRGPEDVDRASGEPNLTLVFVKSLLTKDEQLHYAFKSEVEMYAKLNHAHVTPLLALCREAEPHFMVMEYPEWGDLKQYLIASRKEKHRGSGGKGGNTPGTENAEKRLKPRAPPLTSAQKITIVQQVASGMEHLSQHRFVHGDIAARNVLISATLDAKISSVSLTRESPYAREYSRLVRNVPLPIRWLPSEAIFEDDFSTKSDVHSFAVLVWEIYAQGSMPFKDMTDEALLAARQEGELSLTIPSSTPRTLTALLERAWSPSPRSRPAFTDIVAALGDALAESKI